MNEEQFLASLRCLNSESIEEFYENSLTPSKRMGLQLNLFRLVTKDYSFLMIVYAFLITVLANIKALFLPSKNYHPAQEMASKLPVKSWYCGRDSNCSVVAVIKAVQARYGEDIFKKQTPGSSGQHIILLKDDTQVTISSAEIELTREKAGFCGPDGKSKEAAIIAYTVIIKNAVQREDFDSFGAALKYFNEGAFPEYCADMLGYIHLTMKVEPMRGLNDIVVAFNKNHAVCINHGFIEGYQERLIFAGHDTMGKVLKEAIIIV
jgi:hypothetical protein